MGFLSDTEWDLNDQQDDVDTPPGSPNLAAAQAQAIAANIPSDFIELNGRTTRDYVALCCEEFGLMDTDRDDVLKTSQLHSHLISLRQYARVVALDRCVQRMIVESFLESTDFKDHITRRIQFTFLDAELWSYVRGSTSRLIQHMQLNPAGWRIPPVVHANFLTSKACRKAVVAVASNFRGDMRRKIRRSITDKLDIGGLAQRLCIKGYQPTVGHWRRFALLRSYMQDWDQLPVKPGKSRRTPYWTFIDSKLDKLQEKCAKPNDKDTQKAIKEILKAVVVQDQKKYKGPASGATKLPSKVHMPGWQKDHAKAVQEMSGYAIDASPEDDVDDEDDGEDDASNPGAPNNGERDADGENVDAPGVTGNKNGTEGSSMPDPPTGRILVPATQEIGGPSGSLPSETGGWSSSATVGASGSTSGRVEQSGWDGGSLADRRPRLSHAAPSPLTRPHQSPASSSRHH